MKITGTINTGLDTYLVEFQNYIVQYFQPERDRGFKIEERYGSNTIVDYDNGIIEYEQYAGFDTIEECNNFIKQTSSISVFGSKKKKYIKFSIIENK